MSNLLTVMLQAAPAQQGTMQMIMLLGIVVVFYFFMIRPQMKKQKELRKFREALAKGDKVVTMGGLHGKVTEVKENEVMVEIAKDVVVRVEKSGLVTNPGDLAQQQRK